MSCDQILIAGDDFTETETYHCKVDVTHVRTNQNVEIAIDKFKSMRLDGISLLHKNMHFALCLKYLNPYDL